MIDKAKNGITEGRIVLYTIAPGKVRPAIIVEAWKNSAYLQGEVNLQVFTDFANDGLNPVEWKTSVPYSADGVPGTWSWTDGHACEVDAAPETPAEPETPASEGGNADEKKDETPAAPENVAPENGTASPENTASPESSTAAAGEGNSDQTGTGAEAQTGAENAQ